MSPSHKLAIVEHKCDSIDVYKCLLTWSLQTLEILKYCHSYRETLLSETFLRLCIPILPAWHNRSGFSALSENTSNFSQKFSHVMFYFISKLYIYIGLKQSSCSKNPKCLSFKDSNLQTSMLGYREVLKSTQ